MGGRAALPCARGPWRPPVEATAASAAEAAAVVVPAVMAVRRTATAAAVVASGLPGDDGLTAGDPPQSAVRAERKEPLVREDAAARQPRRVREPRQQRGQRPRAVQGHGEQRLLLGEPLGVRGERMTLAQLREQPAHGAGAARRQRAQQPGRDEIGPHPGQGTAHRDPAGQLPRSGGPVQGGAYGLLQRMPDGRDVPHAPVPAHGPRPSGVDDAPQVQGDHGDRDRGPRPGTHQGGLVRPQRNTRLVHPRHPRGGRPTAPVPVDRRVSRMCPPAGGAEACAGPVQRWI